MFDFITRLFGGIPDDSFTRKEKRKALLREKEAANLQKQQDRQRQFVESERVNLERQENLIERQAEAQIKSKLLKAEIESVKRAMPAFKRSNQLKREQMLEKAKQKIDAAPDTVDSSFLKNPI